jgi:hypothetical protein
VPKARSFQRKPGDKKARASSKEEIRSLTTIFSTAIKTDFASHVSSAIPFHTSSGIKTGFLDLGFVVALIKKDVVRETPGMNNLKPAMKVIQSSKGKKQEVQSGRLPCTNESRQVMYNSKSPQ